MNEEKHFFEVFRFLLRKSLFLYQAYSKNGKFYLYALAIKENNIKTKRHILKNINLFEEKQKIELMSIVHHIESWLFQWECHYIKLSPCIDDVFDFQTIISFPKQDIMNLEEYFYIKFEKKIEAL